MARKKKGLRRRLLGSTKTGRLVRAASLAGVLGGGVLLTRRGSGSNPAGSNPSPPPPVKPSNPPDTPRPRTTPQPTRPTQSSLKSAPTESTPTRRPFTPQRAKNPRKHSRPRGISTVKGLQAKADWLSGQRVQAKKDGAGDLRKLRSPKAAEARAKILDARSKIKPLGQEMQNVYAQKASKESRRRPQAPNWVYPARANKRRRRS